MKLFFALLAVFLLPCFLHAGEPFIVRRVIDGDTITVWSTRGGEFTVRLLGIDTPEARENDKAYRNANQCGASIGGVLDAGAQARAFVIGMIPPGSRVTVTTDQRRRDTYGRILGYVYSPSGLCVNEALVSEGYALVYRWEAFTRRGAYIDLEHEARRRNRTFWQTIWANKKEQP